MKANFFIKTTVAVLLLTLIFAMVSCAPTGTIEDGFLDSEAELNTSHEQSAEETSVDSSVAEGQAHAPVIVDVINVTPQLILISGTCDEGCSVTISDGTDAVTVDSIEGHFVAEYTITTTKFVLLSATAKSDTLTESNTTSFRAEYSSIAMKRSDGLGVTLGSGSHFYYDTDLKYYVGSDTLLTQTELKTFKEFVNAKVTNFRKRAGKDTVELVYVLIPNSITVNPEYLAEGTEKATYKTRYEQVSEALKDTNAITIDMKDIFLQAKADGAKLYYDTDNHLTEYGGYLVYKEICDVMDERYPAAKARDIDTDFTATEVVLNGGNTAKHLGLDTTVITETATIYTPKTFTLDVGNEDTTLSSTPSGKISDLQKYESDDSMILATSLGTSAYRMLFGSNRSELPSALVYRDDFSGTFFDILAERFNRVLFANNGDYTINMTDAQRYYCGTDPVTGKKNQTVDYIFVIVSESNIGKILG